jgi:hypothetical protein
MTNEKLLRLQGFRPAGGKHELSQSDAVSGKGPAGTTFDMCTRGSSYIGFYWY